jgi:hypothetical protein
MDSQLRAKRKITDSEPFIRVRNRVCGLAGTLSPNLPSSLVAPTKEAPVLQLRWVWNRKSLAPLRGPSFLTNSLEPDGSIPPSVFAFRAR